ncbi:MAG: ubiquinol oxidase subunit II [Dokdonella sp.]
MTASLALTACGHGVLNPRGPVGTAEKTILIDSLAIMLSIVIPTIVALVGIAWWFRASNNKARYRPDWEFSGQIELVVWAIPCMVIILLGGVTWLGSYALDPAKPLASTKQALEIQVVSLDWKWLFIYPEQGVAALNELVIPAATPLHFSLTSASVMNAFFIPQLGSMIYTMNGMVTSLNLQADEPGTFAGLSSHYSGEGFSDMHFETKAVTQDDFDHWIAATKRDGVALDEPRYATLSRQSIDDPVMLFGSVEPTLFHKIVMLGVPAGPGPEMAVDGISSAPHAEH